MKLTLGPVLFNWPPPVWRDFYARIADEAPVDRVCIGEAVCAKRSPFRTDALPRAIERLELAGKEVVLTTLAMPTLKRELEQIAAQAAGPHRIEANDMATVALLRGKDHVLGPLNNIYNEAALAEVIRNGATTVCLTPELPLHSVEVLTAHRGHAEIELFAFGRPPLAISARCYHARAHGLTKDACRFVCQRDPDGLDVDTLNHQMFLAINGMQVMGNSVHTVGPEIARLRKAGVSRLRLSPQSCDMVAVAKLYDQIIQERIEASELLERIAALSLPGPICNGYLHGRAGAAFVSPESLTGGPNPP